MKRRELIKKLQAAGWTIKEGGNHSMATHPNNPGVKIPIPRHNEISQYTAIGILKDAGVKEV